MSRYIDADITCRKLSYCRFQGLMRCGEGMKELMQAYNPSSVTVGFDYGTQLALEVVGSIPTADVVEVVHGEWIKADSMPRSAKCSECSCWITRHTINENWFRYCPHCGAKMDEKKVE